MTNETLEQKAEKDAAYFEKTAKHFAKQVKKFPGQEGLRDAYWVNLVRAAGKYEEEGNKNKAEKCYRLANQILRYEGWTTNAIERLKTK